LKKAFYIGLIFILLLLTIRHFVISNEEKNQELLIKSNSPNGTYTIYGYWNNPKFEDNIVTAYLVNNKTSKERIIVSEYEESTIDVKWIDNKTFVINGYELNIKSKYEPIYD
jgi:hypothetical protein